MYFINILLLVILLNFFYAINQTIIKNSNYILIFFSIYTFLLLNSLTLISNIYYFYLMFKLLNISIYMILIYFSNNVVNFKAVINYYFLSFISSLLFLYSIYNFSENVMSIYIINISILFKLGIYPFSNLISKIYSNSGFISFLILSYIINFYYVYILYVFNQTNYLYTTHVFWIIGFVIIITLSTLLYTFYFFSKQIELKGFIAFSSITNIPIIINYTLISIFFSFVFSKEDYNILTLYFFMYLFIYGLNYFIISLISINIEPNRNKSYLKHKLYFSNISSIIYDYSNKFKDYVSILLLIIAGFPPTIIFILKFHIFYLFLSINNVFFVLLTLILLNTLIVYCYIKVLGRLLNSMSLENNASKKPR